MTELTSTFDWSVFGAQSMSVNGDTVAPSEAGATLSVFTSGVASVLLRGEVSEELFDIRFAIADPDDLIGVDLRLKEMVVRQELSLGAIERFLSSTKEFGTAWHYKAGIANYLYGVLARERSPESGLRQSQYREKYDEAVGMLSGYDRAAAEAICAVVAFHFNQCPLAVRRTRSPEVSFVSRSLHSLLQGGRPEESLTAGPGGTSACWPMPIQSRSWVGVSRCSVARTHKPRC